MANARQREWIADVLESVPSIVFLALWRSDVNGEVAGWTGSILAAALLLGFRLRRLPLNPVLLGINLHLVVITPLIVGLFRFGETAMAQALLDTAENGVLVAVFLVGCALTALSPRGFIGADDLPPATRRKYSLLLLAVAAAAVPWSFANAGSTLAAVALPLMALFGLRRFLIARGHDKGGAGDSFAAAGATVGDGD